MNDKFTDYNREEDIAQKINQVVEQTNVHSQFAAELEERLRSAYRPKTSWFAGLFKKVSPTVVWIALMVLLVLVLSLSITTLVPTPQPAVKGTPIRQVTSTPNPDNGGEKTPAPNGKSFDYDGAKLILNAQLPSSPRQANVYALLDTQPTTADYARALANQFGIDGEIYTTQGRSQDKLAFMVTDGKQQLVEYAHNDYTYTSDMVKYSRNLNGFQNENAEAIIREYLKAHNIDFHFRFNPNSTFGYVLEQLSPDNMLMQSAYSGNAYINIVLDEDGNILNLASMLINYDPASLGEYRIISAEEALNRLLDKDLPAGEIEGGPGPISPYTDYTPPKYWYHDYPNDQTVTIYGQVISNQAVDTTKPAAVFIDNVFAIGNTDGMDHLNDFAFVQATGQFILEDGVRKFKVDTWDQTPVVTLMASAHQEGDQIIIADGSGPSYILTDPPADLPLDTELPEAIYSTGAAIDGKYYWTSLQYIKDIHSGGGGGGGGGMGFYKLNLSGTPVPFPTSTPIRNSYSLAELASFLAYTVQPGDTLEKIAQTYNVSVEDLMDVNHLTDSTVATGWQLTIPGVLGPTRLDGERGIVQVQTYAKPDGRQRVQYTFVTENNPLNYELVGDNLEPLQKVANLPIKIWGSLSIDQAGRTFLLLEKFEALYPGLQFRYLKGTQETKEINGTQISLFTTGGTTYVELVSSGGFPNGNYLGEDGPVSIEALQVPGEVYAGYQALRVFMLGTGVNPDTGEPYALTPIADIHDVLPDPYGNADAYIPPNLTIEKVELIYLVNDYNPLAAQAETSQPKYYLQPAWHFQGHTTDGGETDILIQALDQEFLLPEIEQ